jgi:hypothetical protein
MTELPDMESLSEEREDYLIALFRSNPASKISCLRSRWKKW